MTTRWPDTVDEILGGDHVVMLAYVTPASGVVLTPVTNFAVRPRSGHTDIGEQLRRGLDEGVQPPSRVRARGGHRFALVTDSSGYDLGRRSRLRYWIASARCEMVISSSPARSAIVRATRRMRV